MKLRYRDTIYSRRDFFLKRVMDVVGALVGGILIFPFLLAVAIAIRLDSPGPVLFKQKRVGLNGRIFQMYKFRSMYVNADEKLHQDHINAYVSEKLDLASDGAKMKNDPRITRVGRLIRKTSVDELPQLINVLNGSMSLVGPRPVPVYEVDLYNLWQTERLAVLPGITGLWQVAGRSTVSFVDQLRLDIRYIRKYSIWLDIEILFRTIPAVLAKHRTG